MANEGSAERQFIVHISMWEVKIRGEEVIALSQMTLEGEGNSPGPIQWMFNSVVHDQCVRRAAETGMTLQQVVDELNFHIRTGGQFVP